MILQFNKSWNNNNEYSLICIDDKDNIVDISNFDNNKSIYETPEYYYFYSKKIYNIDNYEKFKISAKKGDIVSLTAKDNSYLVYPSKKTFSIAFNIKYSDALQYKYKEVLYNGKPYIVKYVSEKDDKINDGVVYTLKQLCTYISSLIKGYNYNNIKEQFDKNIPSDIIERVVKKYYDCKSTLKFDKKYELNIKRVWQDKKGIWYNQTYENYTKSNRYIYDYYLIHMFAYMIFTKSLNDVQSNNDMMYRFDRKFNTLDEVLCFLSDNQDIVNKFFIDTEILFNNPNYMISSYAPDIKGIYMFYSYNNVKVYVYRNIDKNYFNEKLLKPTYVSKNYDHKIKGIKNMYVIE